MQYPTSPKGDVVETLHGVEVADPYRWLEEADAPATQAWIAEQNAVAHACLDALPERAAFVGSLTRLWSYERFSGVRREGGRLFWFRNDGLQNQSVLYAADRPEDEGRVLLDPNLLSTDGTVALSGLGFSPDGGKLAYAVSVGGSDWMEWRVRDVATGEDLPDRVEWSKFSGASWAHDGSGFYYSAFDAPAEGQALQEANYDQRLMFHRLGAAQADDETVYARPDEPEWGFHGEATEDGRYLVVTATHGTRRERRVFLKDLEKGGEVRPLLPDGDAYYGFVGNDGPRLLFRTDRDAPTGRVIAVHADTGEAETVVPAEARSLESVSIAGGFLFTVHLEDATSAVRQFDLRGNPVRDVVLPGVGTASVGDAHHDAGELFYAYTSFDTPGTVLRLDLATGESTPFRTPRVDFDASIYETTRLFSTSPDGTRVPVFVVHRKGIALDGSHPTLLYGYGGFNVSLTPGFSPRVAAWLESGGVYALACIRGGGEYGKAWHDGGRLANKQNCYDDFIAAAERLIAEGYTSKARLACQGGSNGGLLVGAVVNQRPDLWAAALPAVGVMDLLRFHLFTIGWAWVSDFGSPDSADDFPNLLRLSPLHNLKPGTHYPAVLVTTGERDDRVVPAHSYKYAAALQAAQGGEAPCLIRIATAVGHGAGKPVAKMIEEAADELAFLAHHLRSTSP